MEFFKSLFPFLPPLGMEIKKIFSEPEPMSEEVFFPQFA